MALENLKGIFGMNALHRIYSRLISITKEPTYEELKKKVGDLEKEIIKHKVEKDKAIGTLAGGVAHDLNNILSGVVSYPELLLMDLPEDHPMRKGILTIQKSGQRAADMVQDILLLARRGITSTQPTNLNEVISDYLNTPENLKLKSDYPLIKAKTNLETGLLNILGSSPHLNKTINNLFYNAAQAMPDGGVVNISTQNRYVDAPIKGYEEIKEGDYVTLTFSDTGIISLEDIQRIFEPFYAKKVLKREKNGLGMAVVQGIVKDHNGYINVQSAEGEGTTFTLYFPVTRKEVTKDEAPESIDGYMGKGESILVVDDVPEQREIASRILKKLGYDVKAVPSGEEAVEHMKEHSVDLLVLDMIMDPGINGLETYKRILKICPGQKAIIASGFSETEDIKRVRELGAGQYIKKPYTLETIGKTVRNELRL